MTGSRRHVLRILAACAALPIGVMVLSETRGAPQPVVWHGTALGALSSMTLWSVRPEQARRSLQRMHIEVARLERIFSLYHPNSELVRLNRAGRIARPSRDLLKVLDLSRDISDRSRGAFDPTVQPLWRLHASLTPPGSAQIAAARSLVDFTALDVSNAVIRLGRTGMQLTLNGVAQGYVTDKITDLLRNEGFENAVIELGETRALGQRPAGAPFSIGLLDPATPSRVMQQVDLSDAALAVSGGYGHRLRDGSGHHILDPRTGSSATGLAQVAVIAPTAMLADALSTAIYVAGETRATELLRGFRAAQAILTRHDGTSQVI